MCYTSTAYRSCRGVFSYSGPIVLQINIFIFDTNYTFHLFVFTNLGTENLDELLSTVMQRIGAESGSDQPQILVSFLAVFSSLYICVSIPQKIYMFAAI